MKFHEARSYKTDKEILINLTISVPMTALIGEDKKKVKRIIARGSYARGYFRAMSVNKLISFFFFTWSRKARR